MALELTDKNGKTEYFFSMADLAALRAELYQENEANQTLRAENAALTAECEAAGELIGVMIVPKVKHYNCWYCRVTLTKSEHLPTCEYAVKERAYQQARANRKSKDE